ncbi:hypothetical protein ACSNOK_14755 [Streptomyces sp. URMC 126]
MDGVAGHGEDTHVTVVTVADNGRSTEDTIAVQMEGGSVPVL